MGFATSKFTKLDFKEERINNALRTTNFNNLSRIEKQEDFEESVISNKKNKKIKFFYLGKDNNWRKLLDKSIILRIEEKFKKEMIELNYI